ncbi:hypothetical protein GCM10007301_46580 [Azorhizobium oxalatiphilum]|uniref:Uncharacterized protein n=1 Tax=Azorhizobium oxalatiphilum TaxID=980631 RepID=A0A917FHG3_9HYPH|nr:hypothetical protein [Azorhizobium oxalatiphilum]GGF81123.1 hypothetical protein GCM10007301_46580 [Azorhizobium oxalatiphilum]
MRDLPIKLSAGVSPDTSRGQELLPITHPEEVKAAWEFRIGIFRIGASARCTPAGIVCAGITTAAILLAVSAVIRAQRS